MTDDRRQIQSQGDDGGRERKLSAVNANQAAALPTNGSAAVAVIDRPPALVGVAIPSRDRQVRRHVVALFEFCTWLSRPDVAAAVRWAILSLKFRRLAERLDGMPDGGLLTASGDPRKALGELRALSGEITKLEQALGITASARAALGVNVARGMDLASQMAGNDGG